MNCLSKHPALAMSDGILDGKGDIHSKVSVINLTYVGSIEGKFYQVCILYFMDSLKLNNGIFFAFLTIFDQIRTQIRKKGLTKQKILRPQCSTLFYDYS